MSGFPRTYRSRARSLRWIPAALAVVLLIANLALVALNWPLAPAGVLLLLLPLALPAFVLHRTLTTYFDVRLDEGSVELTGFRSRLCIELDDLEGIEADSAGAPVLRHRGGRARLLLFREELQSFVGDLRSLEPRIEVTTTPRAASGRSPFAPRDD